MSLALEKKIRDENLILLIGNPNGLTDLIYKLREFCDVKVVKNPELSSIRNAAQSIHQTRKKVSVVILSHENRGEDEFLSGSPDASLGDVCQTLWRYCSNLKGILNFNHPPSAKNHPPCSFPCDLKYLGLPKIEDVTTLASSIPTPSDFCSNERCDVFNCIFQAGICSLMNSPLKEIPIFRSERDGTLSCRSFVSKTPVPSNKEHQVEPRDYDWSRVFHHTSEMERKMLSLFFPWLPKSFIPSASDHLQYFNNLWANTLRVADAVFGIGFYLSPLAPFVKKVRGKKLGIAPVFPVYRGNVLTYGYAGEQDPLNATQQNSYNAKPMMEKAYPLLRQAFTDFGLDKNPFVKGLLEAQEQALGLKEEKDSSKTNISRKIVSYEETVISKPKIEADTGRAK